jgi:GTP cyclohydrolase I
MKIELTAEHISQLITAITTPWGAMTVMVVVVAVALCMKSKKAKD